MEIVLGILIALVFVAIIGVLYLKNKQQALDDTPSVSPITHKTKQDSSPKHLDDDEESYTTTLTEALNGVSRLIDTQRYDEASSQLKKLFISNPKSSAVILKLLQVYALTGNQHAFNQYFNKLKEFGDDDSIKEAELFQMVLNDDNGSPFDETYSTTSQTPTAPVLFDDLASDASTPATQTDVASDDPHDFSSFNFDADEPVSTNNHETHLDTEFSELDSPSFDVPTNSSDVLDFGTVLDTPTTNDTLSFEDFSITANDTTRNIDNLSFDTPSLAPTTDNALAFSLDTPKHNDELDFTPSPSPTPVAQADDGFDFSFETSTGSPIATPVADEVSFSDFDLSSPSESTINTQGADDFDFDAFSVNNDSTTQVNNDFDFDSLTTTPSQPNVSSEGVDEFDFDTFTTNESESNQPSIKTTNEFDFDTFNLNSESTAEANTFVSDIPSFNPQNQPTTTDDFNFDIETTNHTIPNQNLDEFNFDSFEPALNQPNTNGEAVDEFNFDDLSINDTVPQTTDQSSFGIGIETTPINEGISSEDAFVFDDLVSTQAPVTTSSSEFSDLNFDEFVEDTPAVNIPQSIIQAPSGDFNFDDTLGELANPANTNIASFNDHVVLPSMQNTTSADSTGLEFVNHLDNVQITLDLAKNYLNLGEHRSAKHLLNEVLKSGTADQQQQAYALLNRLA